MRVSIIILAHQQAEYLAGAIGSAAAQTHTAVEVIVACGDEASAAVAKRLQLALPAITVLTGLDRGRSHAMNTAVARSTGDYVLRLDADDVLAPDCVEQLLEKLPADVVGCDFQEFGSSRRRWSRQWATLTLATEQTANGLPCTSLVARALFDRVGGYDLALLGHEDWAFWIKCLKAGAVVQRVAEPLFFYRRHAGQVMMDHDAVLTAMIRLLHPDLYGVSDQDRAIVRGAPDKVRGWITRRAAWFPADPASQRFAGLLEEPKPSVSAQSSNQSEREGSFTMPDVRTRYLELLKACLTRSAFEDLSPEALQKRLVGADDPDTVARSAAETMIGHKRLDNIQFVAGRIFADQIPGDFIETGVWRGGATIFMRALLDDEPDRCVWVADSFQGLPPPDAEKYPVDGNWPENIFHTRAYLAVPKSTVMQNFRRYGLLDERVKFLQGFFKDTLPGPVERLALLRLDGDMYESTIQVLEALYDKVSGGGFVIVDDYSLNGARSAVHDFRKTRGIAEPLETIDWTGVYWRKSLRP
jgi:Macrocin-O-methyltransferase (TylF)/Glycosyl transferase family 2